MTADELERLLYDAISNQPDGLGLTVTGTAAAVARAVREKVEPAIRADERDRQAHLYRQAALDAETAASEPLAEHLWASCPRDPVAPGLNADPRTVAATAYRHLADRLKEQT